MQLLLSCYMIRQCICMMCWSFTSLQCEQLKYIPLLKVVIWYPTYFPMYVTDPWVMQLYVNYVCAVIFEKLICVCTRLKLTVVFDNYFHGNPKVWTDQLIPNFRRKCADEEKPHLVLSCVHMQCNEHNTIGLSQCNCGPKDVRTLSYPERQLLEN